MDPNAAATLPLDLTEGERRVSRESASAEEGTRRRNLPLQEMMVMNTEPQRKSYWRRRYLESTPSYEVFLEKELEKAYAEIESLSFQLELANDYCIGLMKGSLVEHNPGYENDPLSVALEEVAIGEPSDEYGPLTTVQDEVKIGELSSSTKPAA